MLTTIFWVLSFGSWFRAVRPHLDPTYDHVPLYASENGRFTIGIFVVIKSHSLRLTYFPFALRSCVGAFPSHVKESGPTRYLLTWCCNIGQVLRLC